MFDGDAGLLQIVERVAQEVDAGEPGHERIGPALGPANQCRSAADVEVGDLASAGGALAVERYRPDPGRLTAGDER